VRLGLPISEDLNLSVNYKLQYEDFSNVPADVSTAPANYYEEGAFITSSVGYGLTYSTIDNMQDPRNGTYVKFSQDFAGVGGDSRYVRSVADARYYRELLYDSDIVGLVRLQGGNVTGLGEDVAIRDNFFKGGEMVRGFASYGIGARDTSLTNYGDGDGLPLGGKNFVSATAEVQFPMPLLPPDFGLRGAVFADAGTLFGVDSDNATIQDDASIRSSVGASLLWASPFGLLRADFAYPITKEEYDKTQVFRFSAGTQF
jgi:outer membrane protein insertion porin family